MDGGSHVDNLMFASPTTVKRLMKTPHASHTLACMVRMNCSSAPWEKAFLEECSMPETFHLLQGTSPRNEIAATLLDRGLLDEQFLLAAAGLCSVGAVGTRAGLSTIHLANKLLPSEEIARLFPTATAAAQAALMANPNYPIGGDDCNILPESLMLQHGAALAKYGDIDFPPHLNFFLTHVMPVHEFSGEDADRSRVRKVLAARPELSGLLLEMMGKTRDGAAFEVLVQNPAHMEQVRVGAATASNISRLEVGTALSLSPAMHVSELESMYKHAEALADGGVSHRVIQAYAASHVNAPLEMVEHHLEAPHPWFTDLITRSESPHASFAMRALIAREPELIPRVRDMADSSAELLSAAATEALKGPQNAHILGIVTQPKFPWKEFNISVLERHISEGNKNEFFAAAASANALDYNETTKVCEEYPAAALFSPTLSGFRLDKIAAKSPELAAVAALHPNGQYVDLDAVPIEHQEFVQAQRARSDGSLTAKTSPPRHERKQNLAI